MCHILNTQEVFCLPQPYTLHRDMRRCVSHSTDSTEKSMIAVQTTLQILLEQRYTGQVGGPMTRHRHRINKRRGWGRWGRNSGQVKGGGGGVVLGAPVAEPALPRFAKLTAVLPAPALHPAPRHETLRFTFHGQHIFRATAHPGAPLLPPPHALPHTPLHRNESPGGSDHLRQSLVFSIGLLVPHHATGLGICHRLCT